MCLYSTTKKKNRGQKIYSSPVQQYAESSNLKCRYPSDLNEEEYQRVDRAIVRERTLRREVAGLDRSRQQSAHFGGSCVEFEESCPLYLGLGQPIAPLEHGTRVLVDTNHFASIGAQCAYDDDK